MSNPILRSKLAPIAEAHDRSQLRRKQGIAWLIATFFGIGLLLFEREGIMLFEWQLPVLIVVAFSVSAFLRANVRRIDIHDLARRLEREHPNLHSLLITAVDVEPELKNGDFSYLQKRVIREALAKNVKDPWDQKGNERLFFTQGFHLISIISFVIVAIALASTKPLPESRIAFSGEVEVEPGDHIIERGSSLVVTARFGKKVPAEATIIFLSSDGSSRRIPLKRNLSDPVFGTSLMSVNADAKYHIEYEKRRTEDFHLTVFDVPELRQSDAKLSFPKYTGLPDRSLKDTRRITAIEGTGLTYSFILNKEIEEGSLVGKSGNTVNLMPDPDRPNTYLAKMILTKSDRYDLQLRDSEGRTNRLSSDFVFRVKQNQLANFRLKNPLGNRRFSSVEEVRFEGELWDDYGLGAYGFAYAIGSDEPIFVKYGEGAPAKERLLIEHLLELEKIEITPQSLISYYLWADDLGANGEFRRSYSDMFFAEVRPFEEIFREDQSGQSGQSGNSDVMKLLELQREIIQAIWNLQRRESGKVPSERYLEDVEIIIESQSSAIFQAGQLSNQIPNDESENDENDVYDDYENDEDYENDDDHNVGNDHSKLDHFKLAIDAMKKTQKQLSLSKKEVSTMHLPSSIGSARMAYHHLLQVQPDEFRVSQNGGGGGGNRSQQQLNQLEMTEEANRYETQSEAIQRSDQENEQLQILNRLKELARRQEDLNQRLQELQTALDEADEDERMEVERQLKRLRQEQREMLEDMDELRQRVADQDIPESAQSLSQLDQIRSEAQQTAEALDDQKISQALASGTRTQQDLEALRDDYREQSSGQFSQAMRALKSQANELANRQDRIQEDLEVADQGDRKSLGETEKARQIIENVKLQKDGLSSLLDDIRDVSEDAETAEPLLSRQLHETYRNIDPNQLNEQLEYTSQLARLDLIDKAKEFEKQSHEAIDELKDRIDRAAKSVLGDGIESLRRARLALDELVEEVENEITSNLSNDRNDDDHDAQNDHNEQNESLQNGLSSSNQELNQASNQTSNQDSQQGSNRELSQTSNQDSPRKTWNVEGDGGASGPITGRDFSRFSDRLREVEEMIDVPELQNDVAAVRDRTRAMRIDFRRHGKAPQWDLVRIEIEKPLAEIRKKVGEELARRLSKEAIVPVDRDPVPQRYSELVRRYYETLGGGE